MGNLPVWEDVVSFFKDHLKIIISTIIVGLIVYGIGISYSLYSNTKADKAEEIAVQQGSSGDSAEMLLTKKELAELQEDIVSFNFYVENDEAVQFTNYNLLKELLIAPNITKMIEEKAGAAITPSPELVVNVSLDHSTFVLTLSIGTGDYKLNKAISNAYYESFQDGSIPFFENKFAYIVSTPKIHKETEEEKEAKKEGTLIEDTTTLSPTKIGLYSVIVIIGSALLGTVISLVYSISRKEIADEFGYAIQEDDTVLNFSNLKNVSSKELLTKIGHAISHPSKKVKVLLSEQLLEDELVHYLKQNEKEQSNGLGVNGTQILIACDLSEIDPSVQVEEVILLIKKKKTTKKWYKVQRIQLKNYVAPVKVIQI